jgi:hypothetical protein
LAGFVGLHNVPGQRRPGDCHMNGISSGDP